MVLDSQRANSRHMQHIYLALFTTHLRFFPLSSMAIIAKPPRRKCSFSANANSSGLEDGASSQSKNIISELRSVHDLARVDRYVFLVRFPNPLVKVGWVSNTPKCGKF